MFRIVTSFLAEIVAESCANSMNLRGVDVSQLNKMQAVIFNDHHGVGEGVVVYHKYVHCI